ncbi:MAG: hypothetical protein AAF236_14490 [Verrucomicrobiota bacterium]
MASCLFEVKHRLWKALRGIGLLMVASVSWLGGGGSAEDESPPSLSFKVVEINDGYNVAPPDETRSTIEYRFGGTLGENSFFAGIRLSAVGNRESVSDILFLLHGDKPSYYDAKARNGKQPSIEGELIDLDRHLSEAGAGLLVVQPLCAKQDWHSLYRSSSEDISAQRLARELADQIRGISRKLGTVERIHLHSFSGAGRVDRAMHEAILSNESQFDDLRARLASWTVSDAMVNNAYSLTDKQNDGSVMAVSWARFLDQTPRLRAHFIYDLSGQYHYMQGINLDVFRFLDDLEEHGEIVSEPSVTLRNGRTVLKNPKSVAAQLAKLESRQGRITISSAPTHMATFLGNIADSFIRGSP